jgi:hypothetical protein
MKRIFLVLAATMIAAMAFADESVLIDFSLLAPDIEANADAGTLAQNSHTIVDFSPRTSASYTPEQRNALKSSLAIPHWRIHLAQSSKSVTNDTLSYAKVVASTQFTNVMGVRIHFPTGSYNSHAKILPPFDIPAYDFSEAAADGTLTPPAESPNFSSGVSRFEQGYGVIKNVGAIKSIAVEVYGLNFPVKLFAIYYDGDGVEHVVDMGPIQEDGWMQRTWSNPQYVSEVRNRSLRLYPLYPSYAPYIRFGGFIVQRDAQAADTVGTDCVVYFKDVRVIYDKASVTEARDIDDEAAWGIINERESDRADRESTNFGQTMMLEHLERQKKAPEAEFTGRGEDGAAAPAQPPQ